MFDFSGRTLLLTGADGGIGQAIATTFYRCGASVLLADIDEQGVTDLAMSLDPTGCRASAMKFDAGHAADATAAVDRCVQRFGRLDFVVPGAAIYEDQRFESMSDEQWRQTMSVNLDGVFYLCRRAIPVMSEGGSIVTLASDAAHEGGSVEHSHYGASKGGVLALTRGLARELAPRIRANAVSPGTIDTPMVAGIVQRHGQEILNSIPLNRFGRPAEVAETVAFLCSEAASYITGEAIHVNGGSYIAG